jgi:hypothetical protein
MKIKGIKGGQIIELLEQINDIPDGTEIIAELQLTGFDITRNTRNWYCGSCSRVGLSSLQKYGRSSPNYKQKQCDNIVSPDNIKDFEKILNLQLENRLE